MTPSSPSATTRQADPRIPSEVTEAIGQYGGAQYATGYANALVDTPTADAEAAHAALVQAIADALDAARGEGRKALFNAIVAHCEAKP